MIPTFVVLCIVVANILPLISLCSKNKAEEDTVGRRRHAGKNKTTRDSSESETSGSESCTSDSRSIAGGGPAYLQDDYFDLPGERAAPQYPAAPRPKPAQPVNFKPAVANKFYPSRPAVVNQQIPPRPTTAPAVSKPAIPRPAFASQPVARPPQNLPKPAPLQPAPRPAFVPRAVAPKPAAVAPYTYPAQANVQPFVGPRPPFVNNQQFPNQWPYY
ncbi:unnamed protein product [Haemonchus placei]|uniref:Extensin-like n=1 Tax=Haemonchus placei TaxID=6290 RepID=A0A0N4X3A9_HAEPC|nr:unnamed protein product [Haemonchus placei]